MPNVGDYNQGVTTGTATILAGDAGVTIEITDMQLHPPDIQPMVQLTAYGENSNMNVYTPIIIPPSGGDMTWYIAINGSCTAEVPETISYMIISRIEPKHIQDHTKP